MYTFTGVAKSKVSEETKNGKNGDIRIGLFIFDDNSNNSWLPLKAFNNRIDEIKEGNTYMVTFSIRSREYNGKYYNDLVIVSVVDVLAGQALKDNVVSNHSENSGSVTIDRGYSSSIPEQSVKSGDIYNGGSYLGSQPNDDLPF